MENVKPVFAFHCNSNVLVSNQFQVQDIVYKIQ